MNPNSLGGIGPGVLNQVPTLGGLVPESLLLYLKGIRIMMLPTFLASSFSLGFQGPY